MPVQSKAALAFAGLRVQTVSDWGDNTPFAFLAEFQSTAASLEPDERIKLDVVYTRQTMEWLTSVLADPQASKISALFWRYEGEEDVNSVIPLLINSCPELAWLVVEFKHYSAFDFVSGVLEHPCTKVKVLEMPKYKTGDFARFFTALGQSQVSALTLASEGSLEFYQGLGEYLAKDLLVKLELRMNNSLVPFEILVLLANCTRLVELRMWSCEFLQSTVPFHLSKSITKVALYGCTFAGGFDWLFSADSNVRELDLIFLEGADGSQLGNALVVHLRAKGLDWLRLDAYGFIDKTLAEIGLELGRVKTLSISSLNSASVELISRVLQSPSSETKVLELWYRDDTASSIENHLEPALRHPDCSLTKLRLWPRQPDHKAAAKVVEITFRNRRALFVLLQGQQVRRVYCPLRRLPVEMFRLVGKVLL